MLSMVNAYMPTTVPFSQLLAMFVLVFFGAEKTFNTLNAKCG